MVTKAEVQREVKANKEATGKPSDKDSGIIIPHMNVKLIHPVLVGDSPLICHAWSKKAKEMMLRKQQKKAPKGRPERNPEEDYQESLYHLEGGGYGFPIIAFKSAAVTVCSQIDGISKVFARQTFHVVGDDLLRIHGSEPIMREDTVTVGQGTDLRYRGEFKNWWVVLPIEYNANAISKEQLINLINVSGFGVGIGEYRPEKNGRNGRFHVADTEEAEKLLATLEG